MITKKTKLIVCGTDTDVGKTIISALLVQGLQGVYWKPVQSGLEDGGDKGRVCQLLNLSPKRIIPEIYKFKAPVSPHWAAEKEEVLIDPKLLKIPLVNNHLIIETAGGLMVPLNRQWLQIDQIEKWKLPVILVARSGLGTINHTLLSIEALKKRNISILGIILNGLLHQDNPKTIELLGGFPIIAQLPYLKEVTSKTLDLEWQRQGLSNTFEKLLLEFN